MIFYLKVNRPDVFTYYNFEHWIEIVREYEDSKCFFLCDKDDIKNHIEQNVNLAGVDYEFIRSERSPSDLDDIVDKISDDKWRNATYAHLTVFFHARKHGFKECWNIDADDTVICLSPRRAKEVLENVVIYAKENNIDCFSLDMWHTREIEVWSFGVTYINNGTNWLDMIKKHIEDVTWKNNSYREQNTDNFFAFLQTNYSYNIASFYVENMRFIHYSDDIFRKSIVSGMFYWKNEKLRFPILSHCLGLSELGELEIAEDDVKIDVGITDGETFEFFRKFSLDKNLIHEYELVRLTNEKNDKENNKYHLFLEEAGKGREILDKYLKGINPSMVLLFPDSNAIVLTLCKKYFNDFIEMHENIAVITSVYVEFIDECKKIKKIKVNEYEMECLLHFSDVCINPYIRVMSLDRSFNQRIKPLKGFKGVTMDTLVKQCLYGI